VEERTGHLHMKAEVVGSPHRWSGRCRNKCCWRHRSNRHSSWVVERCTEVQLVGSYWCCCHSRVASSGRVWLPIPCRRRVGVQLCDDGARLSSCRGRREGRIRRRRRRGQPSGPSYPMRFGSSAFCRTGHDNIGHRNSIAGKLNASWRLVSNKECQTGGGVAARRG